MRNTISFTFPVGWYLLFFIAIVLWCAVSYRLNKSERKKSLQLGIIALVIAILVEAIGIGANLWTYTGGNWPIILWPTYFFFGASGYSIFRLFIKK